MVIRFTKATRFFCICLLLAVTALISVGTKSISVSAPHAAGSGPMPVLVYRGAGGESSTGLSLRELKDDFAWLAGEGYTALSEQELVAVLRRESPLPRLPVLLMFDDSAKSFGTAVRPLLESLALPWFPLSKSALLMQELRAAGHAVTRLERSAGFTLEEQMAVKK